MHKPIGLVGGLGNLFWACGPFLMRVLNWPIVHATILGASSGLYASGSYVWPAVNPSPQSCSSGPWACLLAAHTSAVSPFQITLTHGLESWTSSHHGLGISTSLTGFSSELWPVESLRTDVEDFVWQLGTHRRAMRKREEIKEYWSHLRSKQAAH
jgi:hypothetical protein